MHDLNGKCVNVVLAIEMGRGMAFLEYPANIVANFHGRPLESDVVVPEENPVFNTELVWEIEKKELRKVRTTNSPLRVEIQTIDNNSRKERIGFILLSTRSANIIPFDFQSEIPFKWYKLLGVAPEHKRQHPQLYVSLTIRDLALGDGAEIPYLTDVTVEEHDSASDAPFQVNGNVVSLCYLPDGYIKIGSDDCTEKYLLTIIIQVAYNLDLLLPEVLMLDQNKAKYFISFDMFGITIKSKPFCRDLQANIPMNDKIVIRILSEYETVRSYLSEHCQIFVSFYCGSDKLGLTQLNVQTLLHDVSETEFIDMECSAWCQQKCFFKFPSLHGIIPTGPNDRQPYIEVATTLNRKDSRPISSEAPSFQSLEYVTDPSVDSADSIPATNENHTPKSIEEDHTPKSIEEDEAVEVNPTELLREDFLNARGDEEEVDVKMEEVESPLITASGDQNEANSLELNDLLIVKVEKKIQSAHNLTTQLEPISESCKSADTVLKNVPSLRSIVSNKKTEDITSKLMIYQQYCLDVILENIFLKKPIKSKTLRIKFKHPKASTINVITTETENRIGEDIILENTRCKMFFISTTDHFRKMVYAWPPKLYLADENDQVLTEELDVYTALFLGKQRYECSYITECKAVRTYEPLAKISITMYLQEYGLSALPEETKFLLLPPILDEHIALKELQDLQTWRDRQKAQFTADLKIVQKQQLAAMQEDWSLKKKELKEKLTKSIHKCETLTLELQSAVNTIRTKKALEQKEEELSLLPNCSYQDIIEKNNLKYADFKQSQLISTITKFERDNENLKQVIADQRIDMEQIKKTALTKEQTTNLLQQLRGLEEKFGDAQKAKTYFKDQWKKAVREIHDLKSEDQKQIQERIHTQKIELSQLSLESFLSEHGNVGKFDYVPSAFPATPHPNFGVFKWDNSTPRNG